MQLNIEKKTLPVIFSLRGPKLHNEEKLLFEKHQIFGFILFGRNIESAPQVRELIQNLRALYPDRKLYVFVDQEGGVVARLRPPLASKVYKSASHYGKKYARNKALALEEVRLNYANLMEDLISLGFDSPLAPVADLYYENDENLLSVKSREEENSSPVRITPITSSIATLLGNLISYLGTKLWRLSSRFMSNSLRRALFSLGSARTGWNFASIPFASAFLQSSFVAKFAAHCKPTSSFIASRSFGSEVEDVVALVGAAIQGIRSKGGIAVLKHIPGHGKAFSDSHVTLPIVTESLEVLAEYDFRTFKLLNSELNVPAMTAHVLFTCLDEENPVTVSKKAIKYIRENLGFHNQILMTDDICMSALHMKFYEGKYYIKELEGIIKKYGASKVNKDLLLLKSRDCYRLKSNQDDTHEITDNALSGGINSLNNLKEKGKTPGNQPDIEPIQENIELSDEDLAKILKFEKFFGTNISTLIIQDKLEDFLFIKQRDRESFIESLVEVVRKSLDAGVDLILHCSGKIDQMAAIVRYLETR